MGRFRALTKAVTKATNDKVLSSVEQLEREVVGFKRLTNDENTKRNLNPMSQDRMFEVAYWLWENCPLAKWVINITASFMIAEGMAYSSKNPKLKELLDGFWTDPVNNLDIYALRHAGELRLFGELLLLAKTMPYTGKVKLGYLDPVQIETVITDPDNVKVVIGVIMKAQAGKEPRKYKTILDKEVEDFMSFGTKALRKTFKSGDVFYFTVNNVSNSPRGRSDLLPTADWIDVYEEFLYDYSEKWSNQNKTVWDLEIDNNDPNQIIEQTTKFREALNYPNSVFGHNKQIAVTPHVPDLKAMEVDQAARIIRNHILGCHGFPTHWYGGAEDVNKSSSQEMTIPTFKILSGKQENFKNIIRILFNYQIAETKRVNVNLYNEIVKEGKLEFEVKAPLLSTRDLKTVGALIKNAADGLGVANNGQWIDRTTSLEKFVEILGFIGEKVNAEEVKKRLEEQEPLEMEKKEDERVNGDGTENTESQPKAAGRPYVLREYSG